ncbi:hypothetical protein, conserved [Trypanosoma brucei brucei TREU927]|uniref:Uncharacterized protein n=1 Tax=Trypanosoma brucei brucei (strain 927/4 GUTat10.1) TaxID=185431 RepID=Q57YW9_TRYB2|nr:hypothetical protein, conserved [Trypanosoma brucei brucei TREU927]AAX79663.1 hypothetical protein, conserved [Trypanosoma brucei]AAZ13109.1 hypothetical protein, conserved [Trypanosoma brucei brucei TREU927]
MSVGKFKRSNGEPAFAQVCAVPSIPALLRPQFEVIREENIEALNRRMGRTEASRMEAEKIKERCAQAREQRSRRLQERIETIQKRSVRLASAAALREERRLKAEWRQMCRW